jgi:hypothetical protein
MSAPQNATGIPPAEITTMLRLEGFAVLALSVAAYHVLGGNWWVFAALVLAPDLAMFGWFAGARTGARIYNLAHTTTLPALIGAAAWFADTTWLIPYMLIWVAHIGGDRAIGYGLKYPESFRHTHLGIMGKAKSEAEPVANSR